MAWHFRIDGLPWRLFLAQLLFIHIGWCKLEVPSTNSIIDNDLVIALKSLMMERKASTHNKLTLSIHFRQESVQLKHYFNDLVEELFDDDLKDCSQSITYHQIMEFHSYEHYQIVLVDTMISLSFLYRKIKTLGSGNLAYTIIFLSSIRDPYHRDITSALELLWTMSVLNVAIVVQDAFDDIVMVSYYPFGPGACRSFNPVIVNRFDRLHKNWTSNDFFPSKLHNFYGCKLICATWPDMPYLEVTHDEQKEILGFKGIEGELLKFMAGNLNFSIDLYLLNDEQVSATFNESGTIFTEIFDKYADYALGGFQNRPDVSGNATFSQTSYYFLSSVYIVTNIFNVFSAYEKLAVPLEYDAWLLIAGIFLLGFIVIFISGYIKEKQRAFILGRNESTKFAYFHMFVILMGGTKSTLPTRNFARYLLAVWLLTTLVFRNIYQSGMYAMLRDNKQRDPPQTIEDVVLQRYNVTVTPLNVRYLPHIPIVKNVDIINITDLEGLAVVAESSQKTAMLLPYEYFGHFRKINPLSRRLYLVRERIFTQPLSFFVRHNSYLVSVWNDQIVKSQNYGFSQVWSLNLVEPVESISATEASEKSAKSHTVLSMKQLTGIFLILIWAHLCSLGIWLLELTIYRTRRFKHKAWHARIHRLLSPS